MSEKKQKLELTWIGKEKRPRLEPRVLVEDAAKSHHAARRVRRRNVRGWMLDCGVCRTK